MRFAVALVVLLGAAALILGGVAQRTFLKPSGSTVAAATVPGDVRYVVVPAAVLRAHPGQQTVHLAGSGTAFAAYGRAADVAAWLGGERYAELRMDRDGRMLAPVVRTAPAVVATASTAAADPDGSDLWRDQQRSTTGRLDWSVNLPSSMSVLVAADGRAPAPSSVRLAWPVRTATPFAVPLIIAGGLLGVVGLLLYVWALVHVRRRRGPRRKPPAKLPRRPQPPRYRPQRPVDTAPARGRRSVRALAHRTAALGTLLAALLAAAGPVGAATAEEPAPGAAVGEDQAARIVHRIAETAAQADRTRDPELAATRFAGPALALRKAAYRIRAKDRKAVLPQALPLDGARLHPILPQATTGWPRTLFVVASGSGKSAPLALTMVQDDPRSDYKVHYAMALQKGARLPTLPSALDGAARLDAEARVLRVAPAEVARDYGALLQDRQADEAALFDVTGDQLASGVGEVAKKKLRRKLGSTAGITFTDLATDPRSVVAMSTADSGALVSVDLDEKWTVKPKRAGVTVTPGTGGTRILSKTSSSAKGYGIVYGYQLLFSVPAAGSTERAVLLGYAQGLVSAKEL